MFTGREPHTLMSQMKSKSIKRLFRKIARSNDLQVDVITGKKVVRMNCWMDEGAELIFTAYRDKKGRIDELTYSSNWGGKTSKHDHLFVRVDVRDGKKFLKSIARYFGGMMTINRKNIDTYAVMVDLIGGVADGDESTMVSLDGGKYVAFA